MLTQPLPEGTELELASSRRRCQVVRFLGEGTQGAVYAVDVGGREEALKWCHPHAATAAQRHAISALVERTAPDARFLWPSELVQTPGLQGFGYLMPLRPSRYRSLGELLTGKVESDYAVAFVLGRELSDAFLSLHAQGLCYRDINFSNISFDPATGKPLIGDCDNVGIDGQSESAVLGSRRFMAPEIVTGAAGPSTNTDLYSLAVLLFYILMIGHPLTGRRELEFACWDEVAESELFGRSPLFVYDPADGSNAPVPGLHDPVLENWPLYPAGVRDLFTKSFTDGLRRPKERVRESVWRSVMTRLRDTIADCQFCGRQNVHDPSDPRRTCWSCSRQPEPVLRLAFERSFVVLNETTRLYQHHLERNYDFEDPVAEVTRHPVHRNVWGLRNLGDRPWQVVVPAGPPTEVAPGAAVALVVDAVFDFGTCSATLVR